MDSAGKNNKDELIEWIIDAFRRIVVHYGFWFREVEHQFGMSAAHEIEKDVWDVSFPIQAKRISRVFGADNSNGLFETLHKLDESRLEELLKAFSANWLANDGVWFQAVERKIGMYDAKRSNDTCWSRFSPYEAYRIKTVLGLPEKGGLDALKTALKYRLYARLNVQDVVEETDDSFVFRMVDCRVQSARKRKGMQDYPCKSAGIVEYRTFAQTIDPGIKTECVGCPPDDHPEGWYCAWRFSLRGESR